MRLLALDKDVIVFISRVWQTTCTAIRAGEEGFVIDSPVYPDELEALPGVLQQAGFPVSGLLATHVDWDHLLGRLAFPQAALGCSETSASRLRSEPGAAQRELRAFDEEHYVDGRTPLSLGGVQELPVPGRVAIGAEHELELYPALGHTGDGMAILAPWLNVLVCGDYLSAVEIPMLSETSALAAYESTLNQLAELLPRAEWIVPGHGAPMNRETATRICTEDREYLTALRADGARARLPDGRRTGRQRTIHAENVANLAIR
jgi:glyoxylase-like metal-dependent hydrolase (beta-lactamase superfamily II)